MPERVLPNKYTLVTEGVMKHEPPDLLVEKNSNNPESWPLYEQPQRQLGQLLHLKATLAVAERVGHKSTAEELGLDFTPLSRFKVHMANRWTHQTLQTIERKIINAANEFAEIIDKQGVIPPGARFIPEMSFTLDRYNQKNRIDKSLSNQKLADYVHRIGVKQGKKWNDMNKFILDVMTDGNFDLSAEVITEDILWTRLKNQNSMNGKEDTLFKRIEKNEHAKITDLLQLSILMNHDPDLRETSELGELITLVADLTPYLYFNLHRISEEGFDLNDIDSLYEKFATSPTARADMEFLAPNPDKTQHKKKTLDKIDKFLEVTKVVRLGKRPLLSINEFDQNEMMVIEDVIVGIIKGEIIYRSIELKGNFTNNIYKNGESKGIFLDPAISVKHKADVAHTMSAAGHAILTTLMQSELMETDKDLRGIVTSAKEVNTCPEEERTTHLLKLTRFIRSILKEPNMCVLGRVHLPILRHVQNGDSYDYQLNWKSNNGARNKTLPDAQVRVDRLFPGELDYYILTNPRKMAQRLSAKRAPRQTLTEKELVPA
jgi:hypothetical protein